MNIKYETGTITKPKFFYGYVVTAAGFMIWMFGFGTFTPGFSVFYKPLLSEFGWARADMALAISLSIIVQAFLSIIVGGLTDRFGPRIVVTVLGSFLGISYLLLSRVTALWQFQLSYALVGAVGVSVLAVPVMATVSRWFVKARALMSGIVQAGLGVGGILFSTLSGWLILEYDWRTAYTVIGIITLAGIFTSGLFLRRDPRDMGLLPDGNFEEPVTSEKPKHTIPKVTGLPLRSLVRTGQFWMVAGLYASFGFCRSTFTPHIGAHVQDLGFSLAEGANVIALVTGTSLIGRVGIGWLADLISNRFAFMLSFAATAAVLIWGLVATEIWELYLFAFVFGLGWGGQAVLRFSITAEVFGVTSIGLLMGILGFTASIAGGFGSYIAGWIFDAVGHYYPAFWMGIIVSLFGMGLSLMIRPATHTAPIRPPSPIS